MYSLNADVPSSVAALAGDLAADLTAARPRRRGTHTLVVKRLGGEGAAYARLEAATREALTGTAPMAARVADVGVFEEATAGPSPVVYLAVESPGLVALHRRLVDAFEPVEGLEGDGYVPHVTVARGGSLAAARDLASRGIEPVEWVVDELFFWDAEREASVSRVSLPA